LHEEIIMKSVLVIVVAMFFSACAEVETDVSSTPSVGAYQNTAQQYQPFGTPMGSVQQARCPMVDPSSLPPGQIYGSLRPFTGGYVTFVENNSEYFLSRIRVSGKGGPMKELVLFDGGCGNAAEVGLPPGKRVYFRFCPCGENPITGQCKAFLPGTNQATQCRVEADAEFKTWEENSGFYQPSNSIAGRGCVWRVMNPSTTNPERNRLVVESRNLGDAC
jgi:hypothetical protein